MQYENLQQPILVYTPFSGWKQVSIAVALDFARWKFLAIWRGDKETLQIVNSRIKGIQFTLEDVKK